MMTLQDLLKLMVDRKASDLHLKAMRPPLLRVDKKLIPEGEEVLEPERIRDMVDGILSAKQKEQLAESLWVDLGYSLPGVSRFRVSVTHQRSSLGAVFRRIPFQFPSLDEWGLPEAIKEFTNLGSGLVLVTGPTGSGKSSTLAALLRALCHSRPVHVVTIEDPIEFLITDSVGAISQREVGTDTLSFKDALRNVLRQDPDAIAVGEMRDLETIATAITAAETGHLVFSTLHTNSAAQTIDRIIDAFPAKQQGQIRTQLAQVLKGIISLKLVPRADRQGLTAAVEILRNTPRVTKLIEEGNISEIQAEMESSVSFFKMQTMNQSLIALVLSGAVTIGAAQSASPQPEDFERDMRKFLHAMGLEVEEGAEMSNSKADFSKIVEMQEIKRLYDESQDRHQSELADRDRLIVQLRDELQHRDQDAASVAKTSGQAEAEVDKTRKEAAFIKQDLEAKIAKLQTRIKELTAAGTTGDPASSSSRRGFFSR